MYNICMILKFPVTVAVYYTDTDRKNKSKNNMNSK
mgnify:CR=1 FL=1